MAANFRGFSRRFTVSEGSDPIFSAEEVGPGRVLTIHGLTYYYTGWTIAGAFYDTDDNLLLDVTDSGKDSISVVLPYTPLGWATCAPGAGLKFVSIENCTGIILFSIR